MWDPWGKNPILGYTQRLKKVLRVLRCAQKTPPEAQKMQIPRGYQKKMFIVKKVYDFAGKVEISCLRGVGWVPSKKCSFWCNGPSIKATWIPL